MSSLYVSAYLRVRGPLQIMCLSFPDLGWNCSNLPQPSPNDASISGAVTTYPFFSLGQLGARLGRNNKSKGSWRIWWVTRWICGLKLRYGGRFCQSCLDGELSFCCQVEEKEVSELALYLSRTWVRNPVFFFLIWNFHANVLVVWWLVVEPEN